MPMRLSLGSKTNRSKLSHFSSKRLIEPMLAGWMMYITREEFSWNHASGCKTALLSFPLFSTLVRGKSNRDL